MKIYNLSSALSPTFVELPPSQINDFYNRIFDCGLFQLRNLVQISEEEFDKIETLTPLMKEKTILMLLENDLRFGMTEEEFNELTDKDYYEEHPEDADLNKYLPFSLCAHPKLSAKKNNAKFPELVLENPLTMETVTIKSEEELHTFYNEVTGELISQYDAAIEKANAREHAIEQIAKESTGSAKEVAINIQLVKSDADLMEERIYELAKEEYLNKNCCFLPEKFRTRKAITHASGFVSTYMYIMNDTKKFCRDVLKVVQKKAEASSAKTEPTKTEK